MRIRARVISFILLTLFCWQSAVLVVSPFWFDSVVSQSASTQYSELKTDFAPTHLSVDIIDGCSDSSFFEEVMEEEIEVTESVVLSLKLFEFKTFREALILPCQNFSQSYLDPPERTV